MITYKTRQIPETFEEIVDPSHTALIVHEMLNDYVSKGGVFHPNARPTVVTEMLPAMTKLIDAARKSKVKVIYAGYTNYADGRTFTDIDVLRQWDKIKDPNWRPHVIKGTWGHQVIDELKPQEGDHVLDKCKMDAFWGTPLDGILRWNGIKTIVIMGVGGFPGILATVSTAYSLGYFSVAPEDCIRAILAQDVLENAMKIIGRLGTVKQSSDIVKVWANASR